MNGQQNRVRRYIGVALVCLVFVMGTFPAVALVDNAAFVSNSIPDGASVMPKTMFTQTWNFLNTGTSTWSPGQTGYTLNMVGKDSLGALPNFTNTHSSWY